MEKSQCSYKEVSFSGNFSDWLMQSVAVSSFLLVVFHYTSVLGVFTFLGCLFSPFFLFAFGYAFWYYKTVDHAYKGGYNVKILRNLMLWKHFRDYFPVKIHRTQELDSTKNYIFGLHPSGKTLLQDCSQIGVLKKK